MLAQAKKITLLATVFAITSGCFREGYTGDSGDDETGSEGGSLVGTDSETEASTSGTETGEEATGTEETTGDGDGDSTGDTGGAAPYGPCLDDSDCSEATPTCAVPDGSVAGFCTVPCALPAECPLGLSGTASAVCHGSGLCMLSCGDEKLCPAEMDCSNESFDAWPVGGVCTWP
jgi:hypothetical protein